MSIESYGRLGAPLVDLIALVAMQQSVVNSIF
jgi:hypothetical protein